MKHALTVADLNAVHQREPIDLCLDIWLRWMHLADHQHSLVESNQQDTKEFMRAGEAIDTMVNALPRVQWWALRKAKGLCTAWIFKDHVYLGALQDAKDTLEIKMRDHVATRRYFN